MWWQCGRDLKRIEESRFIEVIEALTSLEFCDKPEKYKICVVVVKASRFNEGILNQVDIVGRFPCCALEETTDAIPVVVEVGQPRAHRKHLSDGDVRIDFALVERPVIRMVRQDLFKRIRYLVETLMDLGQYQRSDERLRCASNWNRSVDCHVRYRRRFT